jgi:diguanylate cyclase
MPVSFEPWLVLLSVVIAIQGSYVGLLIAQQLQTAEGLRHRLLLAGASITLAVGIWSMHFVGMLAAQFPFPVDYLVFPTLLSFLICVLVVGIGLFAAQAEGRTRQRLAAGAIAMGCGISGMHFIGMTAVHASVPHHHSAIAVVSAIAIAVISSGSALWLLTRRPTRISLIGAASLLGLGISGMHYTATMGMVLEPLGAHPMPEFGLDSSLSRESMAILTTCIAFAVSAAFLLSLVPEKRHVGNFPSDFMPSAAEQPVAATTVPQGALAPLVGAKALTQGSSPASQTTAPLGGLGQPAARRTATLVIQKDGKPHEISVADIFAVRANAHYTYVFDGEAEYFCNWTISEIESRLDPTLFMRVHRSHIVAIDRIARLKRAGDHGMIELDCSMQCSIPVARARFSRLKSRVGTGAH